MTAQRTGRAAAAALAVAAMAAFASSQAAADDLIRWGSSKLGAGSQTTIAAMASVVAGATDLQVIEQVTGGPAENARLLAQGELEVGQLTSGIAYDAFNGRGTYEKQGKTPLLGLFTLYPANITLAVPLSSGWREVEDLRGKRIAVGPPGSAGPKIIQAWLTAFGITEGADLVPIGYVEGANALRAGTVDAAFIFATGSNASGFTRELDLAMDIVPIAWSTEGEGFKRLQKEAPEMAVPGMIPKGTLKHLDRDIQVPGTYSIEYTVAGLLSEDAAYRLTKAIWDNRADIGSRVAIGKWYGQNARNMLVGLVEAVPVHPGAARFYKEMGVWDDRYTVGSASK